MNAVADEKALRPLLLGLQRTYDFSVEDIEVVSQYFRVWMDRYTTFQTNQTTRAWVKYVEAHMAKEYFTATTAQRKVMWQEHIKRIGLRKLEDYK